MMNGMQVFTLPGHEGLIPYICIHYLEAGPAGTLTSIISNTDFETYSRHRVYVNVYVFVDITKKHLTACNSFY